ncbi:MAG TPA: hypothetical protein PL190_07260 [Caldisericia bacterium]|nr:hypothetical protein [Caldisericia bacterium]
MEKFIDRADDPLTGNENGLKSVIKFRLAVFKRWFPSFNSS